MLDDVEEAGIVVAERKNDHRFWRLCDDGANSRFGRHRPRCCERYWCTTISWIPINRAEPLLTSMSVSQIYLTSRAYKPEMRCRARRPSPTSRLTRNIPWGTSWDISEAHLGKTKPAIVAAVGRQIAEQYHHSQFCISAGTGVVVASLDL